MGKYRYAAPERIRHENEDRRSDVYSLGVILYELLAGKRPYRLANFGPEELERLICREDPPRPSLGISPDVADAPTVRLAEEAAPD